jgi:hypothetical protein
MKALLTILLLAALIPAERALLRSEYWALLPEPVRLTTAYFFFSNTCSTCYISAAGSDSNSGATPTLAWQHAPGMTSATGNAASQAPVAADSYYFRGGDTWHFGNSGASPYTGGAWVWTWSGSSGSPIYIGVLITFFTGGSWVRPIFTGDNPTSTSFVSSCTYNQGSNFAFLRTASQSYITVDNFEWMGICIGTAPSSESEFINAGASTNQTFTNNFVHGWTEVNCTGCDGVAVLYAISTTSGLVFKNNVIDGSDSFCTSANNCTMFVLYGSVSEFAYNFLNYVASGWDGGTLSIAHDNTFEHMYQSYDLAGGQHSDVLESPGYTQTTTCSIYNNAFLHIDDGETVNPSCPTINFFNNFMWDIGNAANALILDPNSAGSMTANIVNNTWDTPDKSYGGSSNISVSIARSPGPACSGCIVNFENNHFIGFSPQALSTVYVISQGTATVSDLGGEVFQSEATANGQGYVSGNNYAPTSSSGATVGAGNNLTGSCSMFSSDSALCSGTSAGVLEGTGSGGKVVVYPAIPINPRPGSGNWNTGAYQFINPSPVAPCPQCLL